MNRVTVLGSCGAWPEGGRACSGFVVDLSGTRVVLDLGYGTLPRLLDLCGTEAGDGIDAVAITHEHPDHMVDLHGLFRARWFERRNAQPIPLFAPEGVITRLAALDDTCAANLHRVMVWSPLPAQPRRIGPVTLASRHLPHHVPNAGIRLTVEGCTVVYTGDTGPDPEVVELGRDADLFIVEATDHRRAAVPAPSAAQHLTAQQAGALAAEAGAQRLMLTHFWPGIDREGCRRDAEKSFGGPVRIASEGDEVALG